uniref:Uncharacterized protein n=1 Tax=Oryza punctata TaxID=4537 RepID=A0A0E0JJL0_ORYPU
MDTLTRAADRRQDRSNECLCAKSTNDMDGEKSTVDLCSQSSGSLYCCFPGNGCYPDRAQCIRECCKDWKNTNCTKDIIAPPSLPLTPCQYRCPLPFGHNWADSTARQDVFRYDLAFQQSLLFWSQNF